jgi:hypothetical protein
MKLWAALITGFAIGALVIGTAVLGYEPEDFLDNAPDMGKEMSLINSGHAWQNKDGRPANLLEEYWKPVGEDVGIIWKPVPDGPDKGILVIREGEIWRELALDSSATYEFLAK